MILINKHSGKHLFSLSFTIALLFFSAQAFAEIINFDQTTETKNIGNDLSISDWNKVIEALDGVYFENGATSDNWGFGISSEGDYSIVTGSGIKISAAGGAEPAFNIVSGDAVISGATTITGGLKDANVTTAIPFGQGAITLAGTVTTPSAYTGISLSGFDDNVTSVVGSVNILRIDSDVNGDNIDTNATNIQELYSLVGGGIVDGSTDFQSIYWDQTTDQRWEPTSELLVSPGVGVTIDTELSVDTISEKTTDNGVSIDGLSLKDAGFSLGGDTEGDVYYRNTTGLARLAKGTSGQVLQMNSSATAPEWGSATASAIDLDTSAGTEITPTTSCTITNTGEIIYVESGTSGIDLLGRFWGCAAADTDGNPATDNYHWVVLSILEK